MIIGAAMGLKYSSVSYCPVGDTVMRVSRKATLEYWLGLVFFQGKFETRVE